MAANTSKCTLQGILTALVSQANIEQNFIYPPKIYEAHYNIVSSFLISECVRMYPSNNEIIDIISPFVAVQRLAITDGLIKLPDSYRNILGSPSIVVKNAKSGECGSDIDVPITTPDQFKIANLKGGCTRRPIRIVPQSEFDYLSTSDYKKPTYWNPIGYYVSNKSIKVCPFDLTKVDIMFVIQEPSFVFGYIVQPDDTYIFDPVTSIESIWTSAAFEPILKGVTALYAAYSRDASMTEWSKVLNQTGLF